MSNDNKNLVKEILIKMNNGKFDLDQFFESIEKETGGKLTFLSFKSYLDKFYDHISKSERILLLKQISLEQTGLINLTDLFNSFSATIKQSLYSPILAFYNVSRKIEKNLKFSSLEFIYKNNLTLEQELNINEFITYICEPVHLDDITAKNIFKCLDYGHKGKILVADFILVIDSYRQDYIDNLFNSNIIEDKKDEEKNQEKMGDNNDFLSVENSNNKYKLNDGQLYWLNKFLQITDSLGLTPYMVFNISANEKNLREMYIDNLRKKLKVIIPSSKISAVEINHISDSFDINKNGIINFDDYTEMIEICKIDPIFSANLPDMNNTSIKKKDEIQLKKLRLKSKNIHNLPVRGNTHALNLIKNELYTKNNSNNSYFSKNIRNSEENKDEITTNTDKNKLERYNSNIFPNDDDEILNQKDILHKSEKKSKYSLNPNFMKNFINELSVFENGEWYFIDILEDVIIEKSYLAVFSLYSELNSKMCPSISRKTVFQIAKTIDCNLDGFVSFSDILQFLSENFNHISLKLALKEMARILEIQKVGISTHEYFQKHLIKQSDEMNSVNFVQVIIKLFNLNNLTAKKLYYELKQLTKKDSITCKLLIDMINEYREKIYGSVSKDIQNDSNYKNTSGFIDKTLFNSEIKKLVKYLQKCFSCIRIEFYNQNKIQSSLFKENLVKFLDLPLKISLMQYRENFLNPLEVNLSMGIALFNEIKSLSNLKSSNVKNETDSFTSSLNSNNSLIDRDDLVNFITSYYDPVISYFDLEIVINLIEKNFSPLKCCFEIIEYEPNGMVFFEIIRIFEKYYSRIAKQILFDILKSIDSEKKGILFYKNINQFLIKYSKNFKFSSDLFFKEISSVIDQSKLPTFEYFLKESKFKNINQLNDKINYYEHNAFFFEKMKFNFELSDFIFVYLSHDSQNNTNNMDKNDFNYYGEEGYSFDKLLKNIDFYRAKIPTNKKILQKEFNKIIDNSGQIVKISEENSKLKSLFFTLNETKNVGYIFNNLFISENQGISAYELFKVIQKEYSSIISRESLIKYIKIFDLEKKGFILYEKFYKILKDNSLIEIAFISDLQIRFLGTLINSKFKGDFETFFSLKNLSKNSFLSYEEFKFKFNTEFFKDEILINSIFEKLKEKKGKFTNMINLQIFADYITFQSKSRENYIYKEESEKENNEKSEEDIDEYLVNIIKKSENFIENFLENIDLKEASNFGKIYFESISNLLKENFPQNFLSSDIRTFLNKFSTIDKMFNFLKFIEWHEVKFHLFSHDEISRKSKESIPNNITTKLFFGRFNINSFQYVNLNSFLTLSNVIFKLSKYESVYCFILLLNSENNPISNEFKVSFDLFLNEFKLEKEFLIESIQERNSEKKLDKFVIITLFKFANFLENLKSKLDLFKNFDADSDGVLTRNEFSNLLKRCTNYGISLNEIQITSIINIADKNGDGIINYIEFIEFINIIKESYGKNYQNDFDKLNSNEKIDLKLNMDEFIDLSSITNITTKYDIEKLKENYQFNLKNFSHFSNVKNDPNKSFKHLNDKNLCLILFFLQGNLIEKLDKFLYEISIFNNSSFDIISNKGLIEILNKNQKIKDLINEDLKEKLWNYSLDGIKTSEKNKLLLEKSTNINNFINNVIKFRIENKQQINGQTNKTDTKVSAFETVQMIGEEAQNEMIKNKIMSSMSTKKKRMLNKNPNFPFNDKNIKNDKLKINSPNNNKQQSDIDKINKGKINKIDNKKSPEKNKMKKREFNEFTDMETEYIDNNFSKKESEESKDKKSKGDFIHKFKKAIDKISNNEYDYDIVPERDYYKRPDGRIVETILNSEEAAIKKCDIIFNSLQENGKFIDSDFGSQNNDGGIMNKYSLYTKGVAPRGSFDPAQIDWYRMEEISPDADQLFISDGADSNDVIQGSLGDCWFISALSVLATKDHLLRGEFDETILDDGIIDEEENVMLSTGVYPPIFHCFRIKNIFCFRFFKDFKWRYVIIDDRLPCRKVMRNQIPKLIYARCKSDNEFWVPLIEKAYAKLHGNYEALVSGFVDEGLVDLTGLTARKINIGIEQIKTAEKCDELWRILKEYSCIEYDKEIMKKDRNGKIIKSNFLRVNNSMMGVSIDAKTVETDVIYNGNKCGLLARHAYSILDTIEIPKSDSFKSRKKSRLLRIRNPWGTKEWNGKWSDQSPEIEDNKESIMKALEERYKNTGENIELDAEDGTFLMSFKDFRKIFTNIYVCIDFPDTYIGIRFFDAWTVRESGGLPINNTEKERRAFSKNPQYYINLKRKVNIQITLLQNDGRLTSSKFPYQEYIRKNCLVLTPITYKKKLESFEGTAEVEITPVKCYRENTIVKMLNPGHYILSACCLNEGDTGTFCLQFNFEDSFIDNEIAEENFLRKLKNLEIERLNDVEKRVKCELIREGTIDEIRSVSQKKCEFLFNNFGKMIKINDSNHVYKNTKKRDDIDEDNI